MASGLASLLGYTQPNPFLDYIGDHRSALLGLAAGIAGGGPDFGKALGSGLQLAGQGGETDYNRKLQSNALDLQTQQRQATAQWARDNGYAEYAPAIEAGAISGSDIFNLLNKQTVVPNGSSVINGKGSVVSSPGAGFAGNDLKSQAWNIVMKANSPGADPSLKQSPEFQSAYAIVTEPTMTPQGMMQPNIPANWGPGAATTSAAPSAAPAAPATPAAAGAPQGSDVAPLGAMAGAPQGAFPNLNPAQPPSRGPGVIPGTQPFNESQARTTYLANSGTPDLKRVIDGYPALMNTRDQILQMGGSAGRLLQTPAYKQARDAMSNDMVNLLYFASGANISKEEWQRKIDTYMPAINDDAQTAVNKLDRFANDVLSLANSSKDPATIAWANQALAGLPQTEQTILAGKGGQKAAPVVDLGGGVTIQQIN